MLGENRPTVSRFRGKGFLTLEVPGKTNTELWALMPLLSNRSKGLNSRSLIGAAGGKKENPIGLTEGMGKKKQNYC